MTIRKEYIAKLISGVRKEIVKHEVEFDGRKCIPATWLDAALLCDVIEEDVLEDKNNDNT